MLLGAVVLLAGCSRDTPHYPLDNRIRNSGEIVEGIRHGLKNHASSVTIRFAYGSDMFDELNGVIDAWVEAALEETEDPAEGDYIRYQYGGYTYHSSYTLDDGRRQYTVTLEPEYYCYASQEKRASAEIDEVLDGFAFTRKTTDAEKVQTIYQWICSHVRYDRRGLRNPYDHKTSTAYAAVIRHLATCQGYCTTLYRMLRESGISCRIVTGTAGEEGLHAWVIAEVDGVWYQLDPTWDAGEETWRYFLKGTSGFADHKPGAAFATEEFRAKYPLAEEDYPLPGVFAS